MTAAITNLDAALDTQLARYCKECGTELIPRGSQCPACEALPAGETRPEARKRLEAEPDAVARLEAGRLRDEAGQHLSVALRKFRSADSVLALSALRQLRDQAQARLAGAADACEEARGAHDQAEKQEGAAVGPLAEAFADFKKKERAEEAARRMDKPPAEQTQAAVELECAGRTLARFKAAAQAATQAREAAEDVLLRAEALVGECERERNAAQAQVDSPESIPLSSDTVVTLIRPLLQMAFGRDIHGRVLAPHERAMFALAGIGLQGAALGEYSAASDEMDAERAIEVLRKQFKDAAHLHSIGDGLLSATGLKAPKRPPGPAAPVRPAPNVHPAHPFSPPGAGLPSRPVR